MTNREKNLPLYVILVGLVLMVIGYAIIFISRANTNDTPVTNQELKQMEHEIKRLENLSKTGYSIKGE